MPLPKKKLTKTDLQHPKDLKSSFNGEKIRPKSDQGFMRAGRVTTTEGKTPPSNTKGVDIASLDSDAPGASTRDVTGCKPIPHGHRFTPAFQRDVKPLTDNQKRMKWKK